MEIKTRNCILVGLDMVLLLIAVICGICIFVLSERKDRSAEYLRAHMDYRLTVLEDYAGQIKEIVDKDPSVLNYYDSRKGEMMRPLAETLMFTTANYMLITKDEDFIYHATSVYGSKSVLDIWHKLEKACDGNEDIPVSDIVRYDEYLVAYVLVPESEFAICYSIKPEDFDYAYNSASGGGENAALIFPNISSYDRRIVKIWNALRKAAETFALMVGPMTWIAVMLLVMVGLTANNLAYTSAYPEAFRRMLIEAAVAIVLLIVCWGMRHSVNGWDTFENRYWYHNAQSDYIAITTITWEAPKRGGNISTDSGAQSNHNSYSYSGSIDFSEPYGVDPDDYDSPEDFADDADGDWDEAYDFWEDEAGSW